MIYSFSRPVITVTTPAGGAILTDQARLTNKRPRSKSQFTWTSGAQTTATTMTLECAFASKSPGAIAIMGTDLPVGMPVAIKFWNGSSFVAPAAPNSGTIVQRPDGRVFVIVLPTGLTDTSKAQIILTNNIGGGTVMTADQLFTIGELWLAPAQVLDIEPGAQVVPDDSTKATWSRDQQASVREGVDADVFTFTPMVAEQDEVFGDGTDAAALYLRNLYATMRRGNFVLCIPRYLDAANAWSPWLASQSAILGLVSQGPGYTQNDGPWYTQQSIKIKGTAIY
jgi:hypothetical protein